MVSSRTPGRSVARRGPLPLHLAPWPMDHSELAAHAENQQTNVLKCALAFEYNLLSQVAEYHRSTKLIDGIVLFTNVTK